MNEERLHSHRSRLKVKTSRLLKERDAEIVRFGAAKEGTARKVILAVAEVQEIERELSQRAASRKAAS